MGTLMDGDVRCHLLGGGSLADAVADAANHQPQTDASHEQAGALLQMGQTAIPVAASDGTLLDIRLMTRWRKLNYY